MSEKGDRALNDEVRRVQVWQVLPVDSCNVSPALKSQWRNGEHWHAVWPEDEGQWCYETQAEASERVAEVQHIRRDRLARCSNYLEDEDRPCTGTLTFHFREIQARCDYCRAWCGWMVADYLDGA